jgi:hypothetical protein
MVEIFPPFLRRRRRIFLRCGPRQRLPVRLAHLAEAAVRVRPAVCRECVQDTTLPTIHF